MLALLWSTILTHHVDMHFLWLHVDIMHCAELTAQVASKSEELSTAETEMANLQSHMTELKATFAAQQEAAVTEAVHDALHNSSASASLNLSAIGHGGYSSANANAAHEEVMKLRLEVQQRSPFRLMGDARYFHEALSYCCVLTAARKTMGALQCMTHPAHHRTLVSRMNCSSDNNEHHCDIRERTSQLHAY